jgi:histidine ammonia-lyase
MGLNSARKTREILDIASGVLGIEFMGAAQALDLRDYTPGRGTRAAKDAIRKHVEFLDEDRPLFPDHNAMQALVESRDILYAVEDEIGALDIY